MCYSNLLGITWKDLCEVYTARKCTYFTESLVRATSLVRPLLGVGSPYTFDIPSYITFIQRLAESSNDASVIKMK